MGHPQGPTPLQFDNKCAHGILTGEMKQKASRTMDMRFYWLRDRAIDQKQFHIHWKRGETNLADYSSKAGHPTKHHIAVRKLYVANKTTIKQRKGAIEALRAICKGVLKSNPNNTGIINQTARKHTNGHFWQCQQSSNSS
ncbi:hypothetical protein CTEN210_06996 [Chaetoceros tenuissimus]|uniref:Uncharacterized protein n=1 Tax=Chaetoceros tenuissimus TaxID=426638 RepID=A0AAD3CTD6_9STRA|nr:hypothetical protein CTEN210_06996 [Chaetoceros tenuissimus]